MIIVHTFEPWGLSTRQPLPEADHRSSYSAKQGGHVGQGSLATVRPGKEVAAVAVRP